ncbi:translocation/assembly module TamB domain-containing protein [Pontibacter vulgaris]|uniref:translocation/assembly module TamB domain-containing protein n=1 Tax=Pontibacter vulgaris TaxID=2905679 RepID=UPI001FA7F074|nr:translocation/assembly module TamB [Pontibacter vulgaris]
MWLLIAVVALVVIIVIALQFPKVQNMAAHKGASYLSKTLKTEVRIGSFTTDWRNALVLKDVYIEDQQQDTLWYSERLGADMKILSLLKGEVNVSKLDLQNATAKMHIRPDSSTNYDFILNAFATDTATAQPTDSTASALKISLDLINLENVYVNFNDELGGNHIRTRVGQLMTTMDELDLDAEKYLVDEIELRNTWVDYVQTKLPPDTSAAEPLTMQFGLNRVELENLKVNYVNRVAEQRINLNLGKSELVADNIDLPNARIDLKSFDLQNSTIVYAQDKYKPSDSLAVNPERTAEELDKAVEKTKGKPVNWVMNLDKMDVSGVDVAFDNFNTPKLKRGMDYDHLRFREIEIDAASILYSLSKMKLDVNQLKLKEQSGFKVENLQAVINVDTTRASLSDLNLKTGHSQINKELAVRYPSLQAVSENPDLLALDLDIENSRIGMQDILYFAPDMAGNPSFRKIANSTLRVDGQAKGRLDNLTIPRLQIAGLQGTNVNVSGNIRNMLEPEKLYLNLDINRLATTRTDILALTPAGTLPPNIRIPNSLSMAGTYRGSLTAFDATADIRSSVGNVEAVVNMDPGPKGSEPFNATLTTNRLDVSKLLTDSLGVGIVSMSATIKGAGLTPETMRAQTKAQIQELNYNNYTYHNIGLDATINRNLYTVAARSRDQNLNFNLNGDFNLRNSKQPNYNFALDLGGADLKKLNFYGEELGLQGRITGNFTGADAGSLSGKMEMRQFLVRHNQKTFPIDSLLLTLDQRGGGMAITILSDAMDAEMRFANSMASLPTALQKHFSNYFDLQPDPPYPADLSLGDFAFEIGLKRTDLITSFVPGLMEFQPTGPLTGTYDRETQALKMDGAFSTIKYTDYTLKDLALQFRGDRNQIGYTIGLGNVTSPSFRAKNVSLIGAARDNDLTMRLAVAENNGQERFVLGGLLNSIGRGYRFVFNPDQLVINHDQWRVSPDNYLQFDTNLLYAHNIRLERNNSFIALNSTGPVTSSAPMQVQFGNFEIGYLMESFQQQDSLMAGTINGVATLRNIMSGSPGFNSDLTVTNFAYMGNPIGNIALKANTAANNRYNVNAALTGNGNQMLVTGFYEAQPTASLLNLNADINSLNIAALEGFMQGMVKDMKGSANGNLRITGTLEDPNINGQLNFNQAQFNLAMLNAVYRLQNERLLFNDQGINFPNFTLTDSLNNPMEINGNIYTKDYTDYRFDLRANTNNFLAMNSTAKDNDLYYGTLRIAADATITGDMARPEIDARVRVLDNSAFTAVVPADEAGAAERKGIVEFVDLSDSLNVILKRGLEEQAEQTGFVGADIEVEITVTDNTPITIVMDPITGDHLIVKGATSPLIFAMTPSGQMNMTGRYDITEGQYKMAFYDIVTRELDIAKGSYIAWEGDPMQADIAITAIYKVETAPLELVSSELGSLEQAEQNRYRTQLPFQVYVKVQGEMLKPEIGFDIQLPERNRDAFDGQIESKLMTLRQDDAEMNKQVFSLLVLGRFMAPDPLQSSGGGFASTARNSLSQVMSDQLSNLTQRYAGGLGLEVGVNSYEDYSSGSAEGRTDLDVAVRQQFLNDRLTVRVGSAIGLEGKGASQTGSATGGFGGDISVEYSLTPDGRLRVRGFQRDRYEDFIEGDVRETGLSLIFVRDYDNFSDLFRSLESRKARKLARREEEMQKIRNNQ